MLRILILILLIAGCSSKERTPYQGYNKKEGGYKEDNLDANLRIVRFRANSRTKKSLAIKFAKFRAIEICLSENFKVAHLLDSFDKTESRTVRRSTTSGYPSYYYGMSPYYHRYSGFGYGFGFSTMDSSYWDEKLLYPDVEIIFECANEVYDPQLQFREVSPDEMKHLVKDLRGGLQIEKVPKDTPNSANFKNGDILIRANGERIQEIYQLLPMFRQNSNHTIRVELIRDGDLRSGLNLIGIDGTPKILDEQNRIIKSACKHKDVKKRKLCQK